MSLSKDRFERIWEDCAITNFTLQGVHFPEGSVVDFEATPPDGRYIKAQTYHVVAGDRVMKILGRFMREPVLTVEDLRRQLAAREATLDAISYKYADYYVELSQATGEKQIFYEGKARAGFEINTIIDESGYRPMPRDEPEIMITASKSPGEPPVTIATDPEYDELERLAREILPGAELHIEWMHARQAFSGQIFANDRVRYQAWGKTQEQTKCYLALLLVADLHRRLTDRTPEALPRLLQIEEDLRTIKDRVQEALFTLSGLRRDIQI